jgi:hypothetical protein
MEFAWLQGRMSGSESSASCQSGIHAFHRDTQNPGKPKSGVQTDVQCGQAGQQTGCEACQSVLLFIIVSLTLHFTQ